MKNDNIITEKQFPSGALLLNTMKGNQRIKKSYMGFTKAEAKAMFKLYLKTV